MIPLLKRKLRAYNPSSMDSDVSIRASVLIPVFEHDGDTCILLTKRSTTVKYHKGEISFPGGMYEETDQDTGRTALRECREEIGVEEGDVEIVGRLDDMRTVTGFVITPYVGLMPYPYKFRLNPEEVEHLIYLPFPFLMNCEIEEESAEQQGKTVQVPAILYGGEKIWGATCKLLLQLRRILEDDAL
jgi:8-oxo-dGTP pyrophosphatase MutT (NUDIX family)